MKQVDFRYSNAQTDPTPSVLVTSQNQHMIRGFNANYLTKGQATRIQNEWRRIQNQNWPTSTKERVLMNRVGKPARNSFRMYRTENVQSV